MKGVGDAVEIINNGNCMLCGKPLNGTRLFLCEECSEMDPKMSDSAHIKELRKEIESLCGNCDRTDKEQLGEIVLSSMVFGFSVGLEASSAERPQGYWIKVDVATYRCSKCGKKQIADDDNELNYCCCCGSRNKMRRVKGADDETD